MSSSSSDVAPRACSAFLEAADEIGRHICQRAIWHETRCNWIGAVPEEGPGGLTVESYTNLTADLYGGTSGVAVFLAHLYGATGAARAREAAMGAMRQALARADETLPPSGSGLYGGRPGLALAAVWVGHLLREEYLIQEALRLLDTSSVDAGPPIDFDLIAGSAGRMVACLIVGDLTGDQDLLMQAARLGDELLESAQKSESGWSWSTPTFPTSGNLTGFSHGASGVGYALLELHRMTADGRYLAGAQEAFRYERGLFDPTVGNWPDLRQGRAGWSGRRTRSYATFWCHGAPGIALSRLRAFQLLGDAECRSEAESALLTTRRSVEAQLDAGTANYSICHGLAGLGEVLLFGERVLGPDICDGVQWAARVAESGLEKYPRRGIPWPCGTQGGENPNLFLGLSGIGLYYLRLFDPTIPSILIPTPEAFWPVRNGQRDRFNPADLGHALSAD